MRLMMMSVCVVVAPVVVGCSLAEPQTPSPDELLELLRANDSIYQTELTVESTVIDPGYGRIPPTVQTWTLTADDGELALRKRVVAVRERDTPVPVPRWQTRWGDDLAGIGVQYVLFSKERTGVATLLTPTPERFDEEVGDGSRVVTVAPAGDRRFSAKIDHAMWSMGRGFGSCLTTIDSVTRKQPGTLMVEASSVEGSWSLEIDEAVGYMVRSANQDHRSGPEPVCSIRLHGLRRQGRRWFPESATLDMKRTRLYGVFEFEIDRILNEATPDLLEEAEREIVGPYPGVARVEDYSQFPPTISEFRNGVRQR